MVINGEGWVDLVLDTSAASLLTLNGGISLAGELGPVTVEVNSAWAYEGDISVRSLTSAGNWIGTGTPNSYNLIHNPTNPTNPNQVQFL